MRMFLIQYFGDRTLHSQERGHPVCGCATRPFVIGEQERDAWLKICSALDEAAIVEPAYSIIHEYFSRRNLHDERDAFGGMLR
jgi:truncated hemoglobin YjbI